MSGMDEMARVSIYHKRRAEGSLLGNTTYRAYGRLKDQPEDQKGNWKSVVPQKPWQFHKVGNNQQLNAIESSSKMGTRTCSPDLATRHFIDETGQKAHGDGLRTP